MKCGALSRPDQTRQPENALHFDLGAKVGPSPGVRRLGLGEPESFGALVADAAGLSQLISRWRNNCARRETCQTALPLLTTDDGSVHLALRSSLSACLSVSLANYRDDQDDRAE